MQHFQEASPEQWSHKAPCRHDIIERSYTFQTEQILYRCLVASWLIQNAIFGPRLVKQQLDDARCVEDSYDAKVALKGICTLTRCQVMVKVQAVQLSLSVKFDQFAGDRLVELVPTEEPVTCDCHGHSRQLPLRTLQAETRSRIQRGRSPEVSKARNMFCNLFMRFRCACRQCLSRHSALRADHNEQYALRSQPSVWLPRGHIETKFAHGGIVCRQTTKISARLRTEALHLRVRL